MKIPVYPRLKQTSPQQAKNFLILLFPNNSDIPLLRSDLPNRETAESVLRGWFELEPSGKGIRMHSNHEDLSALPNFLYVISQPFYK